MKKSFCNATITNSVKFVNQILDGNKSIEFSFSDYTMVFPDETPDKGKGIAINCVGYDEFSSVIKILNTGGMTNYSGGMVFAYRTWEDFKKKHPAETSCVVYCTNDLGIFVTTGTLHDYYAKFTDKYTLLPASKVLDAFVTEIKEEHEYIFDMMERNYLMRVLRSNDYFISLERGTFKDLMNLVEKTQATFWDSTEVNVSADGKIYHQMIRGRGDKVIFKNVVFLHKNVEETYNVVSIDEIHKCLGE